MSKKVYNALVNGTEGVTKAEPTTETRNESRTIAD